MEVVSKKEFLEFNFFLFVLGSEQNRGEGVLGGGLVFAGGLLLLGFFERKLFCLDGRCRT